ncbi:hypothetical protein [Metabacillus halosaccharovorans]|uniref:hypothetical protein n=1 Tax=Metabacillus halosaccharovorans TaxID=930124 RepID=UPI0014733866|nr:hypothetical protein [Metabacillus halosaccharovorans]
MIDKDVVESESKLTYGGMRTSQMVGKREKLVGKSEKVVEFARKVVESVRKSG